jgi:hypothetical protein
VRRGSNPVGLVIGLFFLVGGLWLRSAGAGGWPLGEAEELIGEDPAGDVLGMIGTIWAGVGALLVLLFVVLAVSGPGHARRQGRRAEPPPASSAPQAASVADGLTRLAALKEKGLLSDEEWAQAKALFLVKPSDHRQADAQVLEDLHDLYRAGGLSESEFNTKKWEILARS